LKLAARPKPWSGDALRARVLDVAGFKTRHLRRALRRADEALDATRGVTTIDAEGETTDTEVPDYRTRLEAAKFLFGLAGVSGQAKAGVEATFTGPVVITWKPPESLPSSPRLPLNGRSTNGSSDSTSSSATEDSGKPSWL
jgi:hypothetical protein